MKIHLLLLFFLLNILNSSAQVDLKKTTSLMQECLNLNANTKGSHLALYEHNGVLAYQFSGVVQKIKLEDLDQVQVNKNDAGFSVDIICANENGCITFQKNDTSSQQFQTTAIQFIDARLANTFVQNMASLINHYKPAGNNISQQLFKNENGETPILIPKQAPATKPSPAKKVEQNDDIDEDEDLQVKEEKTIKRESTRKKENDEEKTKTREVKRKSNKVNNQADNEEAEDDVKTSRTEKSKRNHLIEDSNDNENDSQKDTKKK
ncbi:MAG: hypothetical protein UZ11_BCD004000826 [Bacteroidetes bacterium OLB11]|nr:MAG: hypothetical protein UZ11_BCD004000826 [Bacteroidetes bacterium OLB11]